MAPPPSPPAPATPPVIIAQAAPSHGDQLLFGGESSSDEEGENSVYLGPKSSMANDRTNNLLFGGGAMDSTMESTQSTQPASKPVNNARILCYDSD